MEGGRGGGACSSPSLSTSFSSSAHRITQTRLDPDAPGRRGGVAGAAVAVGIDAVLAGFARLPVYARRPNKVQRCTQPLLFELHVDPLQGECRENGLGLRLVAAGHPYGKEHLAAVDEQAACMGSSNVDRMNSDSVVPDVEGEGHRLLEVVLHGLVEDLNAVRDLQSGFDHNSRVVYPASAHEGVSMIQM
jgi:hypothetical protein